MIEQQKYICPICGQSYYQKSTEIFAVEKVKRHGKFPNCPHCYTIWLKYPKSWKRIIRHLRKAIEENPHRGHKTRPSAYDDEYSYCYTCHQLYKEPQPLPYVETRLQSNELCSTSGSTVLTCIPFVSTIYSAW
jgi:hypothetical protein